MRTIQFLTSIALASMLISCGGNTAESSVSSDSASVSDTTTIKIEPNDNRKYSVQSGIITFDNDMMGVQQKSILYFDEYGAKETIENYDKNGIREIRICDGKKNYSINVSQKKATEVGDCSRGLAYKFDWDEISKADQKYKVKKGSNMNIAGKDCESYSMEGTDYPTTFAGWNNICLYQETKSKFGTVTMKAVKVEEVDVPVEKFKVPAGFEITKR